MRQVVFGVPGIECDGFRERDDALFFRVEIAVFEIFELQAV